MPYTEPTSLAIVACPGGEAFANEVITHLKHMYKHRFTLKNDVLSKRYELSKEELVNRINLQNDLQTSDLCIRGATDKYRPPVFKVNARFTYFANGGYWCSLGFYPRYALCYVGPEFATK